MLAHLGAMLAHLGAMLAHLGAMLAHLGAMLAHLEVHVGPSWGLCWRILRSMLAHVDPSWATSSEKWEKMRRAQNTVKRGSFWGLFGGGGGRRQGRRPLSPTERRETPSAMPRPGGPWPDLSAYARQPARGPTMLGHLVAMLAYVGLMLTHVEPKDPKNGNSKKTL